MDRRGLGRHQPRLDEWVRESRATVADFGQRQAEGIRTLEEAVARLEEAVAGLVALPAQLAEADQLAQRRRAAIQEAAHVGLSLETVDWSLPSVPVGPLLPRLDAVRERVRRLMSDPR